MFCCIQLYCIFSFFVTFIALKVKCIYNQFHLFVPIIHVTVYAISVSSDYLHAVRGLESLGIIFLAIPLITLPVYMYIALGMYYRCMLGSMCVSSLLSGKQNMFFCYHCIPIYIFIVCVYVFLLPLEIYIYCVSGCLPNGNTSRSLVVRTFVRQLRGKQKMYTFDYSYLSSVHISMVGTKTMAARRPKFLCLATAITTKFRSRLLGVSIY